MMKVNVYRLLNWIRAYPACIMYKCTVDSTRIKINGDLKRFMHYTPYDETQTLNALVWLMNYEKRFRTIFYYRMRYTYKFLLLLQISKKWLPGLDTIEINGKIGKGLMVHHSFSIISPERAGKNLTVLPGVVIGRGKENKSGNRIKPIIGDNVFIGANASVIGGITIGDNVIIGAGSLVNKDIPSNCIVAGNPARFIVK